VAFEDPDGSKARTLLGAKYLYAFDTCALLRKWKQCPTQPTPSTPTFGNYGIDIDILKSPFSFDDPPADSVPAMTKPITWRQAALQSKATRGAKAKNKT
jgi:hypothetical protein